MCVSINSISMGLFKRRMQISNVLVLIYTLSRVCGDVCHESCLIRRSYGRRSADCYRKEMTQIPRCLPKNIEILDLSLNRIREISREDLEQYQYLEILYLTDNILSEIDDDAFDDQTSLNTLDMSTNPFRSLPKSLFSLPVLRKLYLGNIKNHKMVEDIENAVPITSPLVYLDISQNRLFRLPNFQELPSLQFYNISGNKNVKLNTSMFAGLCNLQELHNDDFSAIFESPCDCHMLEGWLTSRDVKFNPFNCERIECSNEVSENDLDVFNNCRKLHEIHQQQLFRQKLLTNVGISVGAIVGFLLLMLFYIYRRNKRLRQKKKMEEEARKMQVKAVLDD